MYQYQNNELVEDSTRDEGIDDFNDETFGSENPTTDWEPSFDANTSQSQLPDFFKDGPGADFLLDEELESEPTLDQETPLDFEDDSRAYDSQYYGSSTANKNANNDYFFFLDTENETQLDSQMESMFNLVLNDDEDANRQSWSQQSRHDPWSMSGSHSAQPRQQPTYAPQQYSNQGYPQAQDPLAKLLGNQPIPTQPLPPTTQSVKMLTAEELEARLTKGPAPTSQPRPPQIDPAQIAALQRMGVPPHLIPQYLMSMNANAPANFQQPPSGQGYPPQQYPPQGQPPQHAQQHPPQQPHPQQAPPQQPQPQHPHPQQAQRSEEDDQLFSPDQFPALSRNPPQLQQTPTRGIPIPGSNKHTNWVPKQQSPVNSFIESQSPSRGNYNAASPNRGNRPNGQYRIRWKESKEYMSAEEIDSIIRMQETQLQSVGTNTYAEDYYQQTFLLRKKQQEAAQVGQNASVVLHKPLFESNPALKGVPSNLTSSLNNSTPVSSSPMKRGPDPLEGVLGRIPSHSVRAPRPLISLKSLTVHDHNDLNNVEVNTGANKAIQSLLLTIENTFNTLLDIDDIDLLLNNPQSSSHFNMQQIRQKRDELTQELFKSLNVNIPQNLMPNQRMGTPNELPGILHFYPEDELFISLLLVHKGKKLILRCLPVMYPNQVLAVFYSIMRNFSILVRDATREEQEYARLAKSGSNAGLAANITTAMSTTAQFFGYINSIIQSGNVSQTITAMQTILITHPIETELVVLLQHRHGIMILQNLLKRAHDLNLSMFSREPNAQIPPTSDTQLMQLAAAGFHWRETIKSLMTRLRGKFVLLLETEYGRTEKIWEFLAVLVVNITRDEKRSLLLELRDKIVNIQVNPTLLAFLQLAGEQIPAEPMKPAPMHSHGNQPLAL